MKYKTYADLSNDIRCNMHKLSNAQYDLVVGLPRSGMVPAYMIALFLNVNCTDLQSFIENRPIKRGRTRPLRKETARPHDAKKVLIVDDSILTGESLYQDIETIPENLRHKLVTLAIYSNGLENIKSRDDVDIYFEHVIMPCVYEWNIFHHGALANACLDIDGVLCVDPEPHVDDDGEKYKHFLENAEPFILPTKRVHALVTSRLEKYRPETEKWLEKHGVEYDNLIMLNLPDLEKRIELNASGRHKAAYFKKSHSEFFVESAVAQSEEISEITGKLVYCVSNNSMYNPKNFNMMIRNPRGFIKRLSRRIKRPLLPIKRFIMKLFK